MIHKSIIDVAEGACEITIAAGRILIVNVHIDDCIFQVANIHIPPKEQGDAKHRMLRDARASVIDPSVGITLMLGDFNFVPIGEDRINFNDAEAYSYRDPIARVNN